MVDHMKKGSSYMSTRKLCRPRRWSFGKDVASLRHAAIVGYDPLSRYGNLALKNDLPVYILHFRKYAVNLSHNIKHTVIGSRIAHAFTKPCAGVLGLGISSPTMTLRS